MAKANAEQVSMPMDLYNEIIEVCSSFRDMQNQAAGIAHQSKMPDSSEQLHNVLESTEEATTTILDAANSIQEILGKETLSEAGRTQLDELVMKIFEACTFQDISGQRIKKVQKNLTALQDKLMAMSTAVNGSALSSVPMPAAKQTESESLMNGPQLNGEGPSQDDIDKMFSQ